MDAWSPRVDSTFLGLMGPLELLVPLTESQQWRPCWACQPLSKLYPLQEEKLALVTYTAITDTWLLQLCLHQQRLYG